jgi:type II secretory pathway pseudopilin PulG
MSQTSTPRPGKSIIELLVCLGIIAFMATLFLGAAMMVYRAAQNLGK